MAYFPLCIILCRKQFFNSFNNIYTALLHLNVFININQFPQQHCEIAKKYPELTDWELKWCLAMMPRTAEGINKRADNKVQNPGSWRLLGQRRLSENFLSCPDSYSPETRKSKSPAPFTPVWSVKLSQMLLYHLALAFFTDLDILHLPRKY